MMTEFRLPLLMALLILPALCCPTARAADPTPASLAAAEADLEGKPLPPELLQALQNPGEGAILYSLSPRLADPDKAKANAKDKDFRGFIILGSLPLKPAQSAAAGREVLAAMKASNGERQDCFAPRHGLRITLGGVRYDFLMCFECNRMAVYRNNDAISSPAIAGSPAKLNALLRTAGLPLAPAPGD